MEKYFILKNVETLEVYCAPFQAQPENSLIYQSNNFVKPCFNVFPNPTEIVEGATTQEVNELRIAEALEIDLYYTGLISDLLRKHIEKLSIDGIEIPEAVITERDRLRAECNQKILSLGITNFSYRQQNIKL